MTSVSPEKIAVGQRLPYDLFDQRGELLLQRGQLIANLPLANQLKNNGRRGGNTATDRSIFGAIAQIADRLTLIEADIMTHANNGNWVKRFSNLTRDFIEIADTDPDAAFASIHLDLRNSYMVVHHLMAAMVCARLALSSKLSRDDRFSLVAAALSHDAGLLFVKSILDSSQALSDHERKKMRAHPAEGVQLLQRLGVNDPLWLETVSDHHEFVDGSGYHGKRGDQISLPSRMLVLADTYSAMLRPRPHRDRVLAQTALESLYANETDRYDGYLLEALIWDFGFFPPGSMLRLANRELAVAVRNTPGILDRPLVASLTDAQGHLLLKPAVRDTNQPEYAIEQTLDPSMAARAGRLIEECWTKRPE